MPLLTGTNLAKSFGPDDIFSGISLSVPHKARIAIVGPNGIGKTTLLRILAGEESPSAGSVHQARNLTIGYLPQEAGFNATHSLWEECLSAFAHLRVLEEELVELEQEMAGPSHIGETLARYGMLQTRFDHMGGYTYHIRIRQVLSGLGFTPDEYEYPLNHLSGGERTRALLARLLLSDPDLLILDEPTNHLDIQAVEWLENYLNQWNGAALIVSHDRYFLDRVVTAIWEMSRSGIEVYRGNYTSYTQQRQERWELRHQLFTAEKERMEKELDYIRRNISGQNSAQARGRLRRLSRQIEAIESIGLGAIQGKTWGEISDEADISTHPMDVEDAIQRLGGLREPSNRPPQLRLKLKAGTRSGEIILRTYDLRIGYPGNELFTCEDIELHRLECAGLIGPNGSGKTTFLKSILEEVPPQAGEISLGASLRVGYFAQAHEGLNSENTLVQEIDSVAPHMLVAEIRDYLARFLFTRDDVFKPVSVLSGGERGRLALAKLALSDANLLLLDEPTNHLDIPSQEILQEVLAEFGGTILLVSHDRYLIDALATQIWEIDQEMHTLKVFKGTYTEYHALQEAQREADKVNAEIVRVQTRQKSPSTPRPTGEERRRQNRLKELEDQITALESQLDSLSRKLEIPPSDPAKVHKLGNEYVRVQTELDELMEEWGRLHA